MPGQAQAEVLVLKLRELEAQLAEKQAALEERQKSLDATLAEQRGIDEQIEVARKEHGEATNHLTDVQGRNYKVGAEIARLEQAIVHGTELKQRQEDDLRQTRLDIDEILDQVQQDERQLELLTQTLTSLSPGLAEFLPETFATPVTDR